ncbi:MAG: hypothetical protein FWE31_05215 [Firmicutes bacterium]|nr:hypothetical protein [Bacillota bacterium]
MYKPSKQSPADNPTCLKNIRNCYETTLDMINDVKPLSTMTGGSILDMFNGLDREIGYTCQSICRNKLAHCNLDDTQVLKAGGRSFAVLLGDTKNFPVRHGKDTYDAPASFAMIHPDEWESVEKDIKASFPDLDIRQ